MSRRNVLRVDEKTLSKDVSGKVYIVTGANSGVGLETTRQLVKQGGHVIAFGGLELPHKEIQ